ncbi:MAG: hypothetical protein M1358_07510, partial [Chloroflexi bacterium]|nr:hypothetical protein [Chloroflexota bacterium]
MTDVEGILRAHNFSTLKDIADFIGVSDDAKKKEPLVQALAQSIVRKESIERSLAQLDTLARETLDRIVLGGGEAATSYLESSLRLDGMIAPLKERRGYGFRREEGRPRMKESNQFEDVLARLTARGLVFSDAPALRGNSTLIDFRPGESLIIPQEILKHIPKPSITLKGIEEKSLSRIEETAPGSFHRDCQLLISYADANEVVLTKQGLVPKRVWNAIVQTLSVPEDLKSAQGEAGMGRPRF